MNQKNLRDQAIVYVSGIEGHFLNCQAEIPQEFSERLREFFSQMRLLLGSVPVTVKDLVDIQWTHAILTWVGPGECPLETLGFGLVEGIHARHCYPHKDNPDEGILEFFVPNIRDELVRFRYSSPVVPTETGEWQVCGWSLKLYRELFPSVLRPFDLGVYKETRP